MDLLAAIRQNSQQALKPAGVTDETKKAQALLQAKQGRVAPGSGLKQTTNLGEQQAVASTNQQLGLLGQQAETQNQGLGQAQQAQENQFNQQTQALNQERQGIQIKNQQQTNEILNSLKRDKASLDQAQYEARLNQVAQDVRLSTRSYVDNLQREGARARLGDANSFQEAQARATFGDSQKLLEKQLGNKAVLAASDREFNEAMSKMSVDDAYSVFKNALSTSRQTQAWSAGTSVVSAGIGAGATYADNQEKKDYYTGEGKNETGFDAFKARKS